MSATPTPTPTSTPHDDHDHDDEGGDDEGGGAVLAWWRNPLNLISIAVAVAVLAAAIGWVVGNNRALPDPNSVDIGFLQDMRVHHEQAVQMSLIFLDEPGTDQALRTIAREIVVGQDIEIGRMIQLLRGFGESEVNETDVAMSWMGHSVALDAMPGMATESDLIALADAEGADADTIFVQLMTAHHLGGVQMAEHAAGHAAVDEVADMADSIVVGQRDEIAEMAMLLERSRG